ncbi:MAG: AurF N-oxygenase family protein, partial [Actinomycetes bacterium]
MTATARPAHSTPDDAQLRDDRFRASVARLSRQSVEKHFDAYADVPWDDPESAIHVDDVRFRLLDVDPLAQTDWYRSLPPHEQARVGLVRIATGMRIGWEFENVLQRGLLLHAFWLTNGEPEFRYLHHEIIEESQHTMMFNEFVSRSGVKVTGIPLPRKLASANVVRMARYVPALFFLFVLGGEDPVDHLQRLHLKSDDLHPLVQRIMRIHLTEEARHLSFARQFVQREVPKLSRWRRTMLALYAPILFSVMARMMIFPSRSMLRSLGAPIDQVRAAERSATS